jgi:hypothetical protein
MRPDLLFRNPLVSALAVDRGKSGIAAIEFAVIAPLLLLLFVCITDLGLGVYANMQVGIAAQYGAQYALVNGYDANAINLAVKSSSDLVLGVSSTKFCGCAGGDNGVVQLTCKTNCDDGSPAGTYVRVSVKHTYATLLPYPWLPSSFALAAKSTMRLQ